MRSSSMLAALLAAVPSTAFAVSTEIGPSDDPEAAIAALNPGDELVLQGGVYELSGRFTIDLTATGALPILIRAKVGERPHLMRPDAGENIIDIVRADYVTLRGIEFSGGSAGLRISSTSFLTIEDCEIHDTGDVALRANDGGAVYESLRFLRNNIHDTHDTGEGMYLGCNSNGCQFQNGLIEGNWVHHTNAGDVIQGDGIEIKEGSFGNIVRDNVIHDTHYPCILTYSTLGNGAPNIIERNVMWNCGDHGIQSSADAVIRNNLILSANANGIAMQQHQSGAPSNLVVVHNTILKATNDGISVSSNSGTVIIANNAVFAQNGDAISVSGGAPGMITIVGNAGEGAAPGGLIAATLADLESANYGGAPPMDLFPVATGALPGAGDVTQLVADDFNGTPRNGVADIGAYAFAAGGNPGWMITAGFKTPGTPVPPIDGGIVDATNNDAVINDAIVTDGSPDAAIDPDGGGAADGGQPGVDAASQDAARTDSSVTGDGDDREEEGCGCSTASNHASSMSGVLLLAAVFALRRRPDRRTSRRRS